MKVIKPQPLLFQFAPTQIGDLARMGFSLGIAFRLSDPRILVHEANVWAAVKHVRSSVPLCELSLPKKHAEWLLLGHSTSRANASHPADVPWEWAANVKWGDTSKSVSCQSRVGADGVARLSLDHASAAAHPKHIGVSSDAQAPLQLMGRLGVGADSSAAMGPLDQRWPERQKWMPKFEASPEAMASNGTHMGWPIETDLRLFQQAFSNQWSREAQWPAALEYGLHGFGPQGGSIEGRIPEVVPQLLVCKLQQGQPSFHSPELLLQTAWLLPDDDMAVLWWHGEAPLDYVLDNSIHYAAGLIAQAQAPHLDRHLKDIAAIRLDHTRSDLLQESDFPLMPALGKALVWEQVLSAKDHPNHQSTAKRYEQVADELHSAWRNTVELDKELKKQTAEKPSLDVSRDYSPLVGAEFNYVLSKPALTGPAWRDYLNEASASGSKVLEKKTVRDQDLSGLVIQGWTMHEVRFERCNLKGTKFISNQMAQVDFVDCYFERSGFFEVKWQKGEISGSKIQLTQWRQVEASDLMIQQTQSDGWRCVSCALSNCIVDGGSHLAWVLEDCDVQSLTQLKSRIREGYWKKSKLSQVDVISCDCSGLLITDTMVDKFSVIDGIFDRLNASDSKFKFFVLSKKSSLSDAEFSQCVVESSCWIGIVAERLKVQHCSMKQLNIEGVQAQASRWYHSLLDDAHLKDACMADSHWTYVGLRGANLCATDLSDAVIKDCNLADANLAWASLESIDKMRSHNVMTGAQVFPRRQ